MADSPCALALEYRDGVTCREGWDRGVCLNHRVVEGLRVHAVTADLLELENRSLIRRINGLSAALRDIANNTPTLYGYARANDALVKHGSPSATDDAVASKCHCGRPVVAPRDMCGACIEFDTDIKCYVGRAASPAGRVVSDVARMCCKECAEKHIATLQADNAALRDALIANAERTYTDGRLAAAARVAALEAENAALRAATQDATGGEG